MVKFIFGFLLLGSLAMAALTEPDRTLILPRNLLLNGGFELGVAQWVASGGTVSSTTTAASVGSGNRAGQWQSSATNQTFKSSITLPYGSAGKTGTAFCNFRNNTAGSATYKISVTDSSSTLATGTSITSSTTYTKAATSSFIFSAGATTINLVITSQSSAEPQINIDDCYLGEIDPIANAASASRATGTSVGLGGVAVSTSSSTFTTASATYVDVTNLSVTITTGGHPVWVGLVSDGTTNACFFGASNGSTNDSAATANIFRASTQIGTYLQEGQATIPGGSSVVANASCSTIQQLDAVAAGTYTYKVQLKLTAGTTAYLEYAKLVAYEL